MTEYRNTRPDSPKGKVFIAFDTKGEAAARKLGEKLELPAHKVESWLKDDGAGFQAKAAASASVKKEAKPSKKNGKAEAKAAPKKNGKIEAKAAGTKGKKPAAKSVAKKKAAQQEAGAD